MANIEACTRYKGMIICTCSFIINTLVMGIMLNFGVMLPTFLDEFNAGRTLTGRLYDNSQWYNFHCLRSTFAEFALYIGTICVVLVYHILLAATHYIACSCVLRAGHRSGLPTATCYSALYITSIQSLFSYQYTDQALAIE